MTSSSAVKYKSHKKKIVMYNKHTVSENSSQSNKI